jgi:hypothetical protein
MTATVGYRRVSTTDQRLDRQDLGAVDKLFEDQASGKDRDRPGLDACMAYVREGDTLRCYSADRRARGLADLIAMVDELTGRGVQDAGVVKKVNSIPITAAGTAHQGTRLVRAIAMPTGTSNSVPMRDPIAWAIPPLDTTAGYRLDSSTSSNVNS